MFIRSLTLCFQDCRRDSRITGLVESALGEATASEVREVKLHPGTGKLVARMADGFGRTRLEKIEIDQEKLLAADTGAKLETVH